MNKVLDSREPTLSTGSLWLPRVPSGSWGEEVTGTISCHSESPWTLMSSTISLLLKGMAPKKQRTQMKWRRKYSCTGAQCIVIKSLLKMTRAVKVQPQPQDRDSHGASQSQESFLLLNSSALQFWDQKLSRSEAALQAPIVQESTGVLVTSEQFLILCEFNEWYKRS